MENVESDSSPTGIYFWNMSWPFLNSASPQLFSFDLRTCAVSELGTPLASTPADGMSVVSAATDPAAVGMLSSNGTRLIPSGYLLLADRVTASAALVQLAYAGSFP